ncbi:tetratricopeptide repeat protein [Moraxella sp. PS-22]|uniref:Ancillary SecYEG translocon subunit n=1 Tax=Moraxella tetraodonis TaxID=2767221 RepID=A0A9X1URR4_9GAMM|nr:tetratricopeptide repeat protein [Moraxella tetraodonis]MCG8147746.1 tetratricopeptide repeat protein [Moraxella tetraodonis]
MVKDVQPKLVNDEQQFLSALKQYGGYIVSAIMLVLAGYFGWTYWQKHGGNIDTAAANDFAKIQSDQNNIETLTTQAASDTKAQAQLTTAQTNLDKDLGEFVAKHDNSVYTWQALMLQAKQQTDKNDLKAAAATLQKASQLTLKDDGLKAIAILRQAQVLLSDNQADAAQKRLQSPLPAAFEASKLEILGDIANQQGDKKAAATHYQKAWQLIEQRNQNNPNPQDRALLRIKMESLGLSVKQPDLTGGVLAKPTQAPTQVENAAPAAAIASAPAVASSTK